MEEQKSTGQVAGINLDLGLLQLNISLTVSGIQSISDALTQSLQDTTDVLRQNVSRLAEAVNELGVENIKKWAEQGGEEAKEAYHRMISLFQEAYERGSQEAGELLEKFGEKTAEAGRNMQSSSEEPGSVH